LRSPVPDRQGPDAQADLLASLLDSLEVERVAVVGVSAGGPSALQFALRHRTRTAALALIAAITVVPTADGLPWRERKGGDRGRATEFGYWLALRLARSWLLASLGLSREAQALWSEAERAQVDRILEAMLSFGGRAAGYALDRALVVSTDLPLEQIDAPTLVVHALDDALVDYANAEQAMERIPGAEAAAFEQGGHLLLGQYARVQARLRAFLGRALAFHS
jgi:pimeloyl-ACP methyl ester carboxylesterase